jgi:hypothetical protein
MTEMSHAGPRAGLGRAGPGWAGASDAQVAMPGQQDSGSGPGRDWVARSSVRPAGEHGDQVTAATAMATATTIAQARDRYGYRGHVRLYGFTPPHVSAVQPSYTG